MEPYIYIYINVHSQILIEECTGYGVQSISILKSQYTNMTFDEKIRYNIIF